MTDTATGPPERPKVRVAANLPADLAEDLDDWCRRQGLDRTAGVIVILREKFPAAARQMRLGQ